MAAAAAALAHTSYYLPNPPDLLPLKQWNTHRPAHLRPTQAAARAPLKSPEPLGELATSENSKKTQTFLWNAKIRKLVEDGRYEEAIEFYRRMQALGVRADYFTFPFVIKACVCTSSFAEATRVHGRLVKIGLDSDVYVCNSLITMYAKLGSIESARKVFDEMPIRDQVSWNSMMNGYVFDGDGCRMMLCLREMRDSSGLKVDRYSVITVLATCSLERWLKQGKEVHCYVVKHGFELDLMVQTALVDMYCKCEDMVSAERVFGTIGQRNVVAWNALIGGYAMNGRPKEAFGCLIKMRGEEIVPDFVTMVNLLPSCAQLRDMSQGKVVHGNAIRKGFLPSLILETALVDTYAACGELRSAKMLFSQMVERSLVSWNTMITAYVQNGQSIEALELFLILQTGSLKPDVFTISAVVSAYSELKSLRHGRQIHAHAVKLGYGSITEISNSISYMYAKCGDLCSSRGIFDAIVQKDVVSWNTIIMAYAIHGQGKTALQLFSEMERDGFQPNHSTFVSVLSACSISGLCDEGWKYFNLMQHQYNIDPQIEHHGCMVDILGREGSLQQAESFIKRMPHVPTARIWGSLLTASRNHNNINLAELAAKHIFALEHNNTGCFIMLINMYIDSGRWDDVERLRCLMDKEGLQKLTVRSTVELNSQTFSFMNADRTHPETYSIYNLLDIFSRRIGEAAFISGTVFRLQEVLARKAGSPNRHCVRLAVSFGLISSAIGTPILIKKNVRICNSCHHAIKLISKLSRRQIIVGDSSIYHYFRNGICSCGDYW